jgi:APA family basic amino acid/polyamine antiporter
MPVPELKRVLKLPAVVFIAIGFTIGEGVFGFTDIVFKIVGQALPIEYSLTVLTVFISMMPIVMLGSAIPTTGAISSGLAISQRHRASEKLN